MGNSFTIGRPCMDDDECGIDGFCSMNQEDTYPPESNGIGDACFLCESDFDYDSDVDGTDTALFKEDFGRSNIFLPPAKMAISAPETLTAIMTRMVPMHPSLKKILEETLTKTPALLQWRVTGVIIYNIVFFCPLYLNKNMCHHNITRDFSVHWQ